MSWRLPQVALGPSGVGLSSAAVASTPSVGDTRTPNALPPPTLHPRIPAEYLSPLGQSGAFASGTLASGALENGALASGTLASGALESGTLASGALERGALASGALASGTLAPRVANSSASSQGQPEQVPKSPRRSLDVYLDLFKTHSSAIAVQKPKVSAAGAVVQREAGPQKAGQRDAGPQKAVAVVPRDAGPQKAGARTTSQIISELNHRYAEGGPSQSEFEKLGVIVHAFDGSEEWASSQPWYPCVNNCPTLTSTRVDFFSACMVSKSRPTTFNPEADKGGIIYNMKGIKPAVVCGYSADSGTAYAEEGGCFNREECSGDRFWNCAFMPWALDKLLEFQTEWSYNEIILGHGFEFEKRLDAIDAFYYPREILKDDFDRLKAVDLTVKAWSKGSGREIPFIMFDVYNVDKPFSQERPTVLY